MTPLSETERNELNQFVRTRLYERLKFHVLKNLRVAVIGSNRSSDQTALDLAVKEGANVAFDEIEAYSEPDATRKSPIQPRQIHKRNTLNNE